MMQELVVLLDACREGLQGLLAREQKLSRHVQLVLEAEGLVLLELLEVVEFAVQTDYIAKVPYD